MNTDKLIDLVMEKWHTAIGLIAACILSAMILLSVLSFFITNKTVILIIVLFVLGIVIFTWHRQRAVPQNKKNKLGLFVSIYYENDAEAKRIREDFVVTLKRLIVAGDTGKAINFVEVSAHHAKKILDHNEAKIFRIKSKAHFLLYGRVRKRPLNGQGHHIFEMDGIVAHRPVPDNTSKKLSAEFAELLPRRLFIPEDNDFLSLHFTAEWAEIVARYIMGIAAFISGDLIYSEKLFMEVKSKVALKPSNAQDSMAKQNLIYVKIKNRVETLLCKVYTSKALVCIRKWLADRNDSLIKEMGENLSKVNPKYFDHPDCYFLKSIQCFIAKKNTDEARKILNQLPHAGRQAAWYFNQAFLHAYDGNLSESSKYYRKATKHEITPDIISQIEHFLDLWLEIEPEKYQLNFCLGYFNWKIKGDTIRAVKDFNLFLETGDPEEFKKERRLVERWVLNLEK